MEARRSPGEILREAESLLVGGVNSPVRALTKPRPLIAVKGEGPYIYDIEYGRLLDNVLGYGPLILGHRHPEVQAEVERALENGWLYGALAPLEVDLAKLILRYVKPGGKIRFVNSGTEATMLAIRLARAYTGRDKIVKFDGAYHGAHDHVLVAAGSAATHLGVPQSPGVPKCVAENVIVAEYNDFEDIERIFQDYGSEIAGVIVEPVIGNFGVIPPRKGFLQHLRRLTRK
ncbi:MAG: aminotransferase class III-fold pyridoxal phosphate-dependent enzyme, partial [Desulfurococcales archaeon]|nr:aminotransferase class III-fold pyridoxal phosphate-dependent enzyme [Desulfurococcales archaeon]